MEGIFPRHLIHELQLSVTPDSHPTRTGARRVNWAPSAGNPASSEPTGAVFSEPISTSALPCLWKRQSTTSDERCGTKPGAPPGAGASRTLVQTRLLLLLGHVVKVTREARQGENNVCHFSGRVHTSNLVTPPEIIPLEGTGSRFSIPSS